MQEGKNLETPLHVALQHKSFSAVAELLRLEVELDITDLKGNTVLHYAAQSTPQILAVSLKELYFHARK